MNILTRIRRRLAALHSGNPEEGAAAPIRNITEPLLFQFVSEAPAKDAEIVVLVPVSPRIGRQFVNSTIYLVQRAARPFRVCRLIIDPTGVAPPRGALHPYRQQALAAIRQSMVDRYLGSADWVAWIDADIVDYPEDLLVELTNRAQNGIAAPMVLMDGEIATGRTTADGFGCGRFFDVAGFVENLRWARFLPPYFDQPGPAYTLDSVGTCYVVNSSIYREGARHEADPYSLDFIRGGSEWGQTTVARNQREPANCFTEHFSVCQWAREHGLPVRAFSDLIAKHAIEV